MTVPPNKIQILILRWTGSGMKTTLNMISPAPTCPIYYAKRSARLQKESL